MNDTFGTVNKFEKPTVVANPEDRIKSLIELTSSVAVDDSIPIKRYWRSGRELIRMANVYLDEGNLEKCFVLYMKYIILFIEKLPKHPEYKTADIQEKVNSKNICTKIIQLAEEVKTRIKKQYTGEYEAYLIEKKRYDAKLREQEEILKKLHKERDDSKKQQNDSNYVASLQDQLDRKKQELIKKSLLADGKHDEVLPRQISPVESDNDSLLSEQDEAPSAPNMALLTLNDSDPVKTAGSSNHNKIAKPMVDRTTKPAEHFFEDANKLSQLIVPFKSITETFTKISNPNTSRNIETCAILAGKLSHNCFTITHLMVPKQSGTSDSCCANNEEELAIEQENLDLITVGWIHTHPSQRSFLSSIDLHTHAPYQKMLPEAIAIVVAPSTNEIGLYSMTEHGLNFVLKCRKTGFHPHPNESTIYGQPKHVRIDDNLTVEVVDCR